MTTLRDAARQALEVLEFMADEWGFTQKANRPERWRAIEALRAALAQPDPVAAEREACAAMVEDMDVQHPKYIAAAIRARNNP